MAGRPPLNYGGSARGKLVPYNPFVPPLLPKHLRPEDLIVSPVTGSPVFKQRWAWTGLCESLRHQAGTLYNTFFYTKSNVKYAMVFLFPAFLWTTRLRADRLLGYQLYIAEEEIYPDYSRHKFFNKKWSNGRKVYLKDGTTVAELKEQIYERRDKIPKDVRVGCHGRMMEDTDNLAMAVRAFCKRDPKILLWTDDINSPT